jgi:EmrB/QacA subfamily drug resistance transporter
VGGAHAKDGGPVRQHYNVTLAALGLAGLAYALQQTMVLPALPSLQRDLHTTTTWTTWIFTGFLLTSSVLTPVLGKLGDQYGKERTLAISLGIFLVGSIGAATAWNIWSLIGWRALQGAGGAVFPLSFAIIHDEFPPEKAGSGIGAISAVMAAGGGLGLPLSGVLVDHLSWRWLFIVAIAAALVLVVAVVPESPIRTPSPIDYPGAALLAALLVSLLVALSEGQQWGWASARTLGLLAASAALLPIWIRLELRRRQPLVDMRMLAGRTVLFTNLTAMLAGFALFGFFVIVPPFVEAPRGLSSSMAHLVHYGFGASATQAGLILLPGSILGLGAGPLAGVLGRRLGYRVPLVLGMLLTAIGITLAAFFHDSTWQLVVGLAIAGVGVPSSFAAMAKLVVDAVRPEETGVASGMNTVLRTIGGVIGGQAMATLLSVDTIAGTSVPAESAYTAAFLVGAAVAAVAVVTGLLVHPGRGRAGHSSRAATAPGETMRKR